MSRARSPDEEDEGESETTNDALDTLDFPRGGRVEEGSDVMEEEESDLLGEKK